MAVAWPSGVPERSDRDAFDAPKQGVTPLQNTMRAGNRRTRRIGVAKLPEIAEGIVMNHTELETFGTWYWDTCSRGGGEFTKEVFLYSGYQTKTCQFTEDFAFRAQGSEFLVTIKYVVLDA